MFQIKGPKAYLGLLMTAAAVGFVGTAYGENPAANTDTSRQTDTSINRETTSLRPMSSGVELQCGQKLIGMDVKDAQGEKLGSIKEIVLDSTQDRVDYAVLSHGGAAGIGARNIAIPWSEFRVASKSDLDRDASAQKDADAYKDQKGQKDQFLTLNISKDALNNVKGFSGDNLPERVSRSWQQEQATEQKIDRTAAEKTTFDARRLSKLMGSEVRSGAGTAASERTDQTTAQNDMEAMGEKVGEIRDAVIKADNGQLAYAVVKLDSAVEGHGGDLSTVPWSALMIHREPKIHAMLQAPKETLGQFAFKQDQEREQLARLAERDYSRQIFMAYDQGPQWEALGFVSPGESTTDRSTQQPGQSRTPGQNNPNQPGSTNRNN